MPYEYVSFGGQNASAGCILLSSCVMLPNIIVVGVNISNCAPSWRAGASAETHLTIEP